MKHVKVLSNMTPASAEYTSLLSFKNIFRGQGLEEVPGVDENGNAIVTNPQLEWLASEINNLLQK